MGGGGQDHVFHIEYHKAVPCGGPLEAWRPFASVSRGLQAHMPPTQCTLFPWQHPLRQPCLPELPAWPLPIRRRTIEAAIPI